MAIKADFGVFDCPASTGVTAVVASLDFTPKAYILWGTFNDDESVDIHAADHIGMTDGTNEFSLQMADQNGASNTRRDVGTSPDRVLQVINADSDTHVIYATHSSFNGNGFSLDFGAVVSGIKIHWLALGGDGINNVAVNSVVADTSPETGLGFEPDFLFAFCAGLNLTGTPSQHSCHGFGVADGTNEWWLGTYNSDNNTDNKDSVLYTDAFIGQQYNGSRTWQLSLTSFDVGGFTWGGSNSDGFYYMAIDSGGSMSCADFTKVASPTSSQDLPDAGFIPGVYLLASGSEVNETSNSPNGSSWSVGITNGSREQNCYRTSPNNVSNSDQRQNNDDLLMVGKSGDAVPDATASASAISDQTPTITWSPNDANQYIVGVWYFDIESEAGVNVTVPAAALTLTGYAPTIQTPVDVEIPVASLSLTGYAPTVVVAPPPADGQMGWLVWGIDGVPAVGVNITIPVAALTLTGYAPTVTVTEHVDIEIPVAALAMTGYVPGIATTAHVDVEIPVAALAFTGYAPTIATTEHVDVDVPVAALALTGHVPTIAVTEHVDIEVPVAALAFTGYPPAVAITEHVDIEIPVAALAFTGYAPTVSTPVNITVPAGALVLTGYAPTVAVSDHIDIEIPAAALALTGYAPTIAFTAHVDIEVPVAALALTGYVPGVEALAGTVIVVPAATLSLTGYAPGVAVTEHVDIEIPIAALAFTGYAPDVSTPVDITIPVAALALTGYAPAVTASDHIDIEIPVAALALTGHVPGVVTTLNVEIVIPFAELTLTGYAPGVFVGVVGVTITFLLSMRGVDFSMLKRGINFSMLERGIDFSLLERETDFSLVEREIEYDLNKPD